MEVPDFNTLWNLMRKFTFQTNPGPITEDLTCILCKKLMIDASRSICGCQYCYECIEKYLEEGGKYCPGIKTECAEEHLILERDVLRNVRINNKIARVSVLCPNEWCQFVSELSAIGDHLRLCTESSMECPYRTIGCDRRAPFDDTIDNHIRKEAVPHARLYIEYIQNIKNDVSNLSCNFEWINSTILSLAEESHVKDSVIEGLQLEIGYLKEKAVSQETNVILLVERLKKLEKQVTSTSWEEAKTNQANRNGRGFDEGVDERKTRASSTTRNLRNLKDRRLKDYEPISKLENSFCANMDFVWKIEDWTRELVTMTRRGILSQPFYSRNYKMRLRVWSNNDAIGLYCIIMKGEHDVRLSWPMMGAVTLSLLDQQTRTPYQSVTLQYDSYCNQGAFCKPQCDMNDCIGVPSFTLHSTLQKIPSIIVNDSIIVACMVRH